MEYVWAVHEEALPGNKYGAAEAQNGHEARIPLSSLSDEGKVLLQICKCVWAPDLENGGFPQASHVFIVIVLSGFCPFQFNRFHLFTVHVDA